MCGAVVCATAPFDTFVLGCYNVRSERMIIYGSRKMDGSQ